MAYSPKKAVEEVDQRRHEKELMGPARQMRSKGQTRRMTETQGTENKRYMERLHAKP